MSKVNINAASKKKDVEKLNINAASFKALQLLPGIDAEIADAIINNRPYQSLEDLVTLSFGENHLFGDKRLKKIRKLIAIGPTDTCGVDEKGWRTVPPDTKPDKERRDGEK